jgi:hypothetical protein
VTKDTGYRNGFAFLMGAAIVATLACVIIPKAQGSEEAVPAEAHAVEHGETAPVAGAGLVDQG